MSKRFAATEIWDKQWFNSLSVKHKCLWKYLCDKCDIAGVWETNFPLASFQIGETITEEDMSVFGDRITLLECGKYYILGFIEFQYGRLSPDCNPHKPVLKLIEKRGIKGIATLPRRVPGSLKDKDKDKEQDKDKVKDQEAFQKKNPPYAALMSSPHFRSVTVEQYMKVTQMHPRVHADYATKKAIDNAHFKVEGLSNPAAYLKYWFSKCEEQYTEDDYAKARFPDELE